MYLNWELVVRYIEAWKTKKFVSNGNEFKVSEDQMQRRECYVSAVRGDGERERVMWLSRGNKQSIIVAVLCVSTVR